MCPSEVVRAVGHVLLCYGFSSFLKLLLIVKIWGKITSHCFAIIAIICDYLRLFANIAIICDYLLILRLFAIIGHFLRLFAIIAIISDYLRLFANIAIICLNLRLFAIISEKIIANNRK